MNLFFRTLRPVGNPILLQKAALDYTHFANTGVIFYQSGTAALAAALIAAKSMRSVTAGKPEVLLPAYACPDLISACVHADVTPVLVDFEPNTCWMSLEQIENRITEHTLAIIAVRFLGIAERMANLRRICEHHGLILIEDSAQGFPILDAKSYWAGDLSILSFGRGKPINMLGGGAVIIRNPDITSYLPKPGKISETVADALKYRLKVQIYNLLIKPLVYGMATRLPGLNIGETVYKPLHEITGILPAITSHINSNITYFKTLPNIAALLHARLKVLKISGMIDLPQTTHHDFHNPLLRYPILITQHENRNLLQQRLQMLGASLMYQKPLYQISGVPRGRIKSHNIMSQAEAFSRQLITLPTHTGVTEETIDEICSVIQKTLG